LLFIPDRLLIGGEWLKPSSDATIDVIDSDTEEVFFQVAEAQPPEMHLAIDAGREAFDRLQRDWRRPTGIGAEIMGVACPT
jgi:acyl-CoA reductase-like NAD-dependent aldehyde dehydrogenase